MREIFIGQEGIRVSRPTKRRKLISLADSIVQADMAEAIASVGACAMADVPDHTGI